MFNLLALIVLGLTFFGLPEGVFAADPLGAVETSSNCNQINGWAGDPDNPNSPIQVAVFDRGPAGSGTLLGYYWADSPRESGVCQALGGQNCSVCPTNEPQCKHAYIFDTPNSLKDGNNHQVYIHGINLPQTPTSGNNPILPGSPITLNCPNIEPTPTPTPVVENAATNFQVVESNASSHIPTSWNIDLPKLTNDNQYLYALVVIDVPNLHGLAIKRKRLGSTDPFQTIWTTDNVFSSNGGVLLDKRGALHVFYYTGRFVGTLQHVLAGNPQSLTGVNFVANHPPSTYGATSRGRLGLAYDAQADIFPLTTDNTLDGSAPPFVYYGTLNSGGGWSQPVKILDYYDLSSSREQDFYYPKIIVDKNVLHIFFTASVYDKPNPDFRWLNGIYHGYKSLPGGNWSFEWVWQTPWESEMLYLQDAYITKNDELALVLSFHNCNYQPQCLVRKTLNLFSPTGLAPWTQSVISPDKNYTACVQKTTNGSYQMFLTYDPPAYFQYAKSDDGINWQFLSTALPLDKMRLPLGHNCMEQDSLFPTSNGYALVSGLSPAQNDISVGHTVVLAEIVSKIDDLDNNNYVDLRDFFILLSNQIDIFNFNSLVSNFGK